MNLNAFSEILKKRAGADLLRRAALEIAVLDHTADAMAGMARNASIRCSEERQLKLGLQASNSRLHERLLILRSALEKISRSAVNADRIAVVALGTASHAPR